MFEKTKTKISTHINDRVSQPIRTAIIISCAAFVMAAIALVMVVNRADH